MKKNVDVNFNQCLDDSFPATSSSGLSQHKNSRGSNSNYVPFAPLPADTFAKKPESVNVDESMHSLSDNYHSDTSNIVKQNCALSGGNDYLNAEKKNSAI